MGGVARARQIAQQTIDVFHEAVFAHHTEQEKDLFMIVLAKAEAGEEHERVRRLVDQLTAEHRDIEAQWRQLETHLKKLLKGDAAEVDGAAIERLVRQYQQHARIEETELLPLSAAMLGRESADLAALGLSLHTGHVVRGAPGLVRLVIAAATLLPTKKPALPRAFLLRIPKDFAQRKRDSGTVFRSPCRLPM